MSFKAYDYICMFFETLIVLYVQEVSFWELIFAIKTNVVGFA